MPNDELPKDSQLYKIRFRRSVGNEMTTAPISPAVRRRERKIVAATVDVGMNG